MQGHVAGVQLPARATAHASQALPGNVAAMQGHVAGMQLPARATAHASCSPRVALPARRAARLAPSSQACFWILLSAAHRHPASAHIQLQHTQLRLVMMPGLRPRAAAAHKLASGFCCLHTDTQLQHTQLLDLAVCSTQTSSFSTHSCDNTQTPSFSAHSCGKS